jgi:hypothetical protein
MLNLSLSGYDAELTQRGVVGVKPSPSLGRRRSRDTITCVTSRPVFDEPGRV